MKANSALVVMDFENEIVHPEGKFKAKGYSEFVQSEGTLKKVGRAIENARQTETPVVFVRVGFDPGYLEQPKQSPLFGKAHEFDALKLGTWATELHEDLDVRPEDVQITKHRVSPFYGTDLELQLRSRGITHLYLAGVSTDLVVESAARDAHDRDFQVTVLSDCCAAGSMEDHESALKTLAKITTLESVS